MDALNEMHPTLENSDICFSKIEKQSIIFESGESTMHNIGIYQQKLSWDARGLVWGSKM